MHLLTDSLLTQIMGLAMARADLPPMCVQDMDLGEYHLPKGTAVVTAQYSFHHNPEYWPDVDKFQPER